MRRIVFWSVLALVVFMALATGAGVLYRLLYGMASLIFLSYLIGFLGVQQLDARVHRLTSYLQVGESVEIRLTLRNLGWWPRLLLEVRHQANPAQLGGWVVSLWSYRSVSWMSRTQVWKRGAYSFGRLEITSRDPLGLFSRSVGLGAEQSVLVYPATVDLPGFQVPSGRSWGEGMASGRTFLPSSIAGGVREHQVGDEYRRIHWRSTARLGRLMVKEFEPEPAGPSQEIWIVLDLWEPAQKGEGAESTAEYGVSIAASIARRFLEMGRTVGLVVWGQQQVVIRAGVGPSQESRIMETLAMVQPGSQGPVLEAATATSDNMVPSASVVMITSEPGPQVSIAANMLQSQGAFVVPVLLDAASFSTAVSGVRADGVVEKLAGLGMDAYVIHRGDDIGQRLDTRIFRPRQLQPESLERDKP